jgi:hypothetical protein
VEETTLPFLSGTDQHSAKGRRKNILIKLCYIFSVCHTCGNVDYTTWTVPQEPVVAIYFLLAGVFLYHGAGSKKSNRKTNKRNNSKVFIK